MATGFAAGFGGLLALGSGAPLPLSSGFLWVCISEVTFFNPEIKDLVIVKMVGFLQKSNMTDNALILLKV